MDALSVEVVSELFVESEEVLYTSKFGNPFSLYWITTLPLFKYARVIFIGPWIILARLTPNEISRALMRVSFVKGAQDLSEKFVSVIVRFGK
jgi:hypothetical protein